jgi:hypothetical protein
MMPVVYSCVFFVVLPACNTMRFIRGFSTVSIIQAREMLCYEKMLYQKISEIGEYGNRVVNTKNRARLILWVALKPFRWNRKIQRSFLSLVERKKDAEEDLHYPGFKGIYHLYFRAERDIST